MSNRNIKVIYDEESEKVVHKVNAASLIHDKDNFAIEFADYIEGDSDDVNVNVKTRVEIPAKSIVSVVIRILNEIYEYDKEFDTNLLRKDENS